MSKHLQLQFDQLDRYVDSIIAGSGSPAPIPDQSVESLVPVLRDLKGLPRDSFRARLKTELEREAAAMSKTGVSPIPAGYRTISAYVTVVKAAELIEWLKRVAGAQELFRTTGSAGGIHCEMQIGDSMVMIGGGSMVTRPMPTSFHLVTDRVDEMYSRALAEGAESIQEPSDQPYGERVCSVKDPSGNQWSFAKAIGDSNMHRGLRTLNVYLHPVETPKFIEFLKQAFAAEEVQLFASPEGVVHHAKIRVGDSILEMGEAHGPYQAMPTAIYMYVPDCDAVYEQAVRSGAKSITAPVDQPYGDRSSAVEDPFGNTWYIATHIRDM